MNGRDRVTCQAGAAVALADKVGLTGGLFVGAHLILQGGTGGSVPAEGSPVISVSARMTFRREYPGHPRWENLSKHSR